MTMYHGMDCMEGNLMPMFNGIHIGEQGVRYAPHPMDMDIKLEMDHMMDGMVTPGSSMSPGLSSSQMGIARARKNKEDKICGVCGDRALGYNFDAISCESCKAFFRRNAPKGLDYFKCPYDEKCKMDISNRRFCKRCRLRKCFEIGMRKEYILTEEERALKRKKIEDNRTVNTGTKNRRDSDWMQGDQSNENRRDTDWMLGDQSNESTRDRDRECMPGPMPVRQTDMVTSQTKALSLEDSELIDELMHAYHGSLEVSMEKEHSRDNARDMSDLVNIAEISVRRVIDMAKKIKAFKSLPQVDQISLLKGGSIELLILRSVITFDKDKQHFLDPNDSQESALNLDQLRKAEGGLFEDHMKFVKAVAFDMTTDQPSLILLLMIALFSPDRPALVNKDLVSAEQEKYSLLLQKYLESKFPDNVVRGLFPKLLMKLTDIRNLNEEHSQVLLKVNPEGIQPLMQEVLDLKV